MFLNEYFQLGNKKRARVRQFKGTIYIDFREYFLNKDNKNIPTKKGVTLNVEGWKKLQGYAKEIDTII